MPLAVATPTIEQKERSEMNLNPRTALALFYCAGGLPDGTESRMLIEARNKVEALALWLELRATGPVTSPTVREIKAA
jgi:hypothetical protein